MFRRLYNAIFKTYQMEIQIMATLASIDAKLNTVLTAIANISSGDNSALLAAIAGLKADVDTNVEGAAPAPAPAPVVTPTATTTAS